jgi:hypothetical protein
MNNLEAFFVISRYKEDFSWVKDYTDRYIVYNKGEPILNDPHIINTENIGMNLRDVCKYIYENYDNLPKLVAFLQAHIWDHCRKETFDKLIYNDHFTALEYYGPTPANAWEARTADGEFLEINNSWYISAHYNSFGMTCKYSSFDQFMEKYFSNYVRPDWIRFAPGAQYIVEDWRMLHYPKSFWKSMMEEQDKNNMVEGFMIERGIWMIFQNTLILKELY